jgi:flagellar L-ring protein precursor FlgH
MGLQSEIKNDYSGEGKSSRKGKLKAKMTARITQVLPNGNFLIEGTRIVDVNGERQTTVLTGVIRPQDITPENTVFSYDIADAQISYKGRGSVNTAQRPGIFARFLNWLF